MKPFAPLSSLVLLLAVSARPAAADENHAGPPPPTPTQEAEYQARVKEQIRQTKEQMERMNVPINFYGKVVSTMGRPLAKVRVNYVLRSPEYLEHEDIGIGNTYRSYHESVLTGADGTFAIKDKRGSALDFTIMEKEGFCQAREASFTVDYIVEPLPKPDKNAPEVFILHPNRPANDVVAWETPVKGLWGPDPIHIDLVTGKPSGAGALTIVSNRSGQGPEGTAEHIRGFDWNVTFTVAGGEIQEAGSPRRIAFAPEQGYGAKVEIGSNEDRRAKPFHGTSSTVLYFKKDGDYGLIRFDISPSSEPNRSLRLKGFVNFTGGRNLEPAPNWQMYDHGDTRSDANTDGVNARLLAMEQSGQLIGMPLDQFGKIPEFRSSGWNEPGLCVARWTNSSGKGYQWICEFNTKGVTAFRKLKIE